MILAVEKHQSRVVKGQTLNEAAFKILKQRYEEGWYEDWNDGDQNHDYERRARDIVRSGSGHDAWWFLKERADDGFEYEWVEIVMGQ